MTPLPRLPAKIGEITGSDKVPTYQRCYHLSLNGILPIETVGNRLYVRDADLPKVVALFGLTIRAAADHAVA